MPQVRARGMLISKTGNTESECEDAFGVLPIGAGTSRGVHGPVVAVVADGASESILAAPWAKAIVGSMTSRLLADHSTLRPGARFSEVLDGLKSSWKAYVDAYVYQRSQTGNPLKWYEEKKLASGAFATFLAFRVDGGADYSGGGPTWSAASIGDSCLFQLRDGQLLTCFPLQSCNQFTSRPGLFGSLSKTSDLVLRANFLQGASEENDEFFLMTDALAAYFLSVAEGTSESLGRVSRTLGLFINNEDHAGFSAWVEERRISGILRNDDVAVVHVKIGE